MKTELTAYEIADAFPKEVREYCPNIVQNLELKLILKRAKIRSLELSNHDLDIKILAEFFIKYMYPVEIEKQLNKYKRCLELIKIKNKDQWFEDEAALRWAKAQPIEGLYSFENLRKYGNRTLALCPFHSEKTPSFVIYRDKNKFHCFGCHAQGDSIDFFMKLNNVHFKKAVEELQ